MIKIPALTRISAAIMRLTFVFTAAQAIRSTHVAILAAENQARNREMIKLWPRFLFRRNSARFERKEIRYNTMKTVRIGTSTFNVGSPPTGAVGGR